MSKKILSIDDPIDNDSQIAYRKEEDQESELRLKSCLKMSGLDSKNMIGRKKERSLTFSESKDVFRYKKTSLFVEDLGV